MRELGCHVIDADRIARDLVEPGRPAFAEIVREFGQEVVAPDGGLDRPTVASIVFSDPRRLATLNAIVHPRVMEEEDRQLAELQKADPSGVAVVEAALLIESGFYRRLDRLIVVWCRPEQQLARLTEAAYGRRMAREDAERRMAAQISIDEKRRLANDVIDASGTIAETRPQVTALVDHLKSLAAATSL